MKLWCNGPCHQPSVEDEPELWTVLTKAAFQVSKSSLCSMLPNQGCPEEFMLAVSFCAQALIFPKG